MSRPCLPIIQNLRLPESELIEQTTTQARLSSQGAAGA
jgi:hypothetical protein